MGVDVMRNPPMVTTALTLAVQFRRGARAIYHYANVEPATFAAFKGAESIGTYFGQHLKALPFEKFPCEDVAA